MAAVSVICRIARNEWREWGRDGRLSVLLACVVVLLLAGSVGGIAGVRETARLRAELTATDREQFLAIRATNEHEATHVGRYLFVPVRPLSFLDRGLLDGFGRFMHAESHRQRGLQHPVSASWTTFARFGNLTPDALLRQLVPLLILLLMAGSLAGERETGTDRQLFAAGVSRRQLLLGKAAAGAVVVAGVLAVIAIGGLTAIGLVPGTETADELMRLGGLIAIYAVYYTWWLSVALVVSSRARRAGVALAVGVAIWIATAQVLPRIAAEIASEQHAQPTWSELDADIRRDGRAAARTIRNGAIVRSVREPLLEKLLAEHRVARVEDLPFYFEGVVMEAEEEMDTRAIRDHWGRVWERYAAQESAMRVAAGWAPTVLVGQIAGGLAGTDLQHTRHFFDAAEQYRLTLVQALNRAMAANMRITGSIYAERQRGGAYVGDEWFTYQLDPHTLERIPDFAYESLHVVAAIAARRSQIAGFAVWLAVAVIGAAWASRRGDVV
jgi:ABC-2 type transport system permease protein